MSQPDASRGAGLAPAIQVTPVEEPAEEPAEAAASEPFTYSVQQGDELADIADRFGIDVPTLVNNNRIPNRSDLYPGEELTVLPVSGLLYDPEDGDTVADLALRFDVAIEPIVVFNGLPTAGAAPLGRSLIIPGASPLKPRLGQTISEKAMSQLGARYVWGGVTPSGFDCSGFLYWAAAQSGHPVPRDHFGQIRSGERVARADLEAGDLLFFGDTYMGGVSHSGIYVGDGTFVHAGTERTGVILSSLADPYWAAHWYGATRVRD
jgi:peptidoglycan endopeptidase LytE